MTFHLQVVAGIHYTAGMRHAIVSQQLIDKIDPNREIETQNEVRMSFFFLLFQANVNLELRIAIRNQLGADWTCEIGRYILAVCNC